MWSCHRGPAIQGRTNNASFVLQLGRINEGLLNVDTSRSPPKPPTVPCESSAGLYDSREGSGCSLYIVAGSFPSKDQRFLRGMKRAEGVCMFAVMAEIAQMNFHTDSRADRADHTSMSRSDRTLNVHNYALQMHLCLKLFSRLFKWVSSRNTLAC